MNNKDKDEKSNEDKIKISEMYKGIFDKSKQLNNLKSN